MATLNNPFVVYGYKGAEYFCDRQKAAQSAKTINMAKNTTHIVLSSLSHYILESYIYYYSIIVKILQ